MKASNFYAIAILLVGLVMLASARPRFEVRELQMGRRILEDALKLHSRVATDRKESEEDKNETDFMKKLFDLNEHESIPNFLDTKSKLPTPENGPRQSDAAPNENSYRPKTRVRRRCSPVLFGCTTPSTIIRKHRKHKQAYNRRF